MNNPKEADFATKQENTTTTTTTTNTPTSWSKLKDPRIVRVSRAFGGKDRHSKVCTVKGLRDRRVRLSVPTAIQLYDLQDRLGLNQPSKVVDWLLNAAKHEIDELPPLQIPQGMINFTSNLNFTTNSQIPDKHGLNIFLGQSRGETSDHQQGNENWARNEFNPENQDSYSNYVHNSFPSNLTLSQYSGRDEDFRNFSLVPLPPTLSGTSSSSHHHQVLVYQPAGISTTTQSYFPNNPQISSQLSDSSLGSQNKHNEFHLGQP